MLSFIARNLLGTMTGVRTASPVVALTFDDGPDPAWTPRLAELLERHGALGTFFMIGKRAAANPEVVARIARAGHAIGNHSWDHPSFPLITRRERFRQVRLCAAALSPHGTSLFRPPHGDMTLSTRIDLAAAGYRVVTWNVIEPDWGIFDPEALASALVAKIRPGCIVLLHDALWSAGSLGCFDRENTIRAVDIVLERLSATMRFVTVPELLRTGRPRRVYWSQKPDAGFLDQLRPAPGMRNLS